MAKVFKMALLCFSLMMLVAVQVQANPGMGAPGLKGKIVETMDAGGYTYVNLDSNGTQNWAAVPQTKVKIGDVVEVQGGMAMQNFTSKTLGRTFPNIIFASGLAKR